MIGDDEKTEKVKGRKKDRQTGRKNRVGLRFKQFENW